MRPVLAIVVPCPTLVKMSFGLDLNFVSGCPSLTSNLPPLPTTSAVLMGIGAQVTWLPYFSYLIVACVHEELYSDVCQLGMQ